MLNTLPAVHAARAAGRPSHLAEMETTTIKALPNPNPNPNPSPSQAGGYLYKSLPSLSGSASLRSTPQSTPQGTPQKQGGP